ncbi:MAG: aldehyde dehydrogenase family protein, partial [Rubrobacter sp.]
MKETQARSARIPERLTSLDPATGEAVGEHPVMGLEEVREAVTGARESASWWAGLGFAGRKKRLMAWKGELALGIDELAALIRREMGKPLDDARLEVVAGIDNVGWVASNAGRVLR